MNCQQVAALIDLRASRRTGKQGRMTEARKERRTREQILQTCVALGNNNYNISTITFCFIVRLQLLRSVISSAVAALQQRRHSLKGNA